MSDEELRAADAVLVSGILVQAPSMREMLARAARPREDHRRGRPGVDALGARGGLSFVDDNFIGNRNRKTAARLLPELARWQRAHGNPFDLYREASVELAGDDGLVLGLVDAGFTSVFLGLETPDPEALIKARKRQNPRASPPAPSRADRLPSPRVSAS